MEREVTFNRTDRLDRCESKGAAISWPIPLDNLLDLLVLSADTVGQKTTRKELAAAIVLAASREPEQLAALVTTYRLATVADVCSPAQGDNVIDFQVRRPGPRPRTGSA